MCLWHCFSIELAAKSTLEHVLVRSVNLKDSVIGSVFIARELIYRTKCIRELGRVKYIKKWEIIRPPVYEYSSRCLIFLYMLSCNYNGRRRVDNQSLPSISSIRNRWPWNVYSSPDIILAPRLPLWMAACLPYSPFSSLNTSESCSFLKMVDRWLAAFLDVSKVTPAFESSSWRVLSGIFELLSCECPKLVKFMLPDCLKASSPVDVMVLFELCGGFVTELNPTFRSWGWKRESHIYQGRANTTQE